VSYSARVGIAADDVIQVVIDKNDRAGRTRRIDLRVNSTIGIAVVPVSQGVRAVNVITAGRVRDPQKLPALFTPSTIVNAVAGS